MLLVLAASWLAFRSTPFTVDRRFRRLQQFISSSLFSLAHSGNHAQKTMGILCGVWRIVRAIGSCITHLSAMQGFSAETGSAIALFGATWLGIPVSTTRTITSAIVSVGDALGRGPEHRGGPGDNPAGLRRRGGRRLLLAGQTGDAMRPATR